MNLLYISNGYADSTVHCNLTKALEKSNNIKLIVYCPIRTALDAGKNQYESCNTRFIYSFVIKSWYKYVYHYKQWRLYQDLIKHIDCSSVDLVHAATAFSDGAIAYRLYKKYGIPYVISVRAVDTYDFIGRRMYHTWPLGKKIFQNAKAIYFISATGMQKFTESNFSKNILEDIKKKMYLRPNGVDHFWLQNIDMSTRKGRTICYMGTFLKRKNIARLIEAVESLRENTNYSDVSLKIIGGGKDEDGSITELIKSKPDFIDFKGQIREKSILVHELRECCIFAMPSFVETFGLVYIEALTQNLPIIYSKNDGIDGLFDSSVGISVHPKSTVEIRNAIKEILDNHCNYGNGNVDFGRYDWNNIASQFLSDYNRILNINP